MKRKISLKLAFILTFIIGFVFTLLPYFSYDFGTLPGDLGDTRFNLYILEHFHQYLIGNVDSYWNATFMYPAHEVISLSDNLLGTAPFYSFFRFIGLPNVYAMQAWIILITFFNFWASYKLIRWILNDKISALLGAFIFTFSIGLIAQMNHVQMFPRFAAPLAILFALMWMRSLNPKYFFISTLFFVYQLYCAIYLGFLMFVPWVIIILYSIIINRVKLLEQIKLKSYYLKYIFGILVNLALTYALFAPYIRRSKSSDLHSFDEISSSLPSMFSYFSSSNGSYLWSWTKEFATGENAYWDHYIFPGILTFIGFGFVIYLFSKQKQFITSNKSVYAMCLAGFLTFLIYLRVGDYSIYALIHKLPGFGAMRSLTRIINIELLFFGFFFAVLVYYLLKNTKRKFIAFISILVLLTIDNLVVPSNLLKVEISEINRRHEQLIDKMKNIPKDKIVSYQPTLEEGSNELIEHYQIDAMFAAQALQLKTINGYSGQAALDFHKFWREPNDENRAYFLRHFPHIDEENIVVIE